MRTISIFLAASLLCGCGTMQIGEGSFIHPDGKREGPPQTRLDVAPLLPGATVTEETLATPDGAMLRGVLTRRPGVDRAILYFGGNAFHLDRHGRELLPLLGACGTNVAVFDYRGYGRSSGKPTLATMKADALRMFDHVSALHPGGVIVHGQSLGSFMAGYVAQQRPATRALVLEATGTTVPEWVDVNVPWYVKLFLRVEVDAVLREVDNAAAVAHYRGASLVLAGENDKLTPPSLGRKVYEAIPGESKRWFLARGAGHNAIFSHKEVGPVYCALVKGAL